MPVRLMIKELWDDPEICGRIYLQAVHLFANQLLADQWDVFFSHTSSVMHKLSATKYHLNNYCRIEEAEFQSLKTNPPSTDKAFEAFELIFEIEAFLFQIKSSLDMLAKLLIPIIGNEVRTVT